MRIALLTLLLAMFLPGSIALGAAKYQKISFTSKDGTKATGYFYQPKGKGPFPMVIALHGCAGLFSGNRGTTLLPAREDWLRRFLKAGYAVFFPDSNGTRGFRSICKKSKKTYPIKLTNLVRDLVGVTNWLADQPNIDHAKVAMLGWAPAEQPCSGYPHQNSLIPRDRKLRPESHFIRIANGF